MERMGDILARTARSRARHGRLSAAQPTQPTQSAQPIQPTQRQMASQESAPSQQARQQPSAPQAIPTTLSTARAASRVMRPTAPIGRRTPMTRGAPLSAPAADVAQRAIPPADALDVADALSALDSERILELPSARVLSAPGGARARATGPLSVAGAAAPNGVSASPSASMSANRPAEPPAPREPVRRGATRPLRPQQSQPTASRMSAGSSGMLSLGEAAQGYARAMRPKGVRATGGVGRRTAQSASAPAPDDDPNVCPLCHGAGYVRLDVPVGDPAFGQAVACACKERLLEDRRMSDLRRMSSLDAFRDKTFATFESSLPGVREALEVARRYAEDPHGWLVLSGGYGVGKTHLAAAIAHERLASGQSVFFSIVPDLLDHLRAAFAPSSEMPYDELFDKVREAGVLVLDDLGAENATAWATEKLFQIINYRYNYRMPTVITTNHRLLSHMDERIRSRLSDRSFVRNVAIDSTDYRERHAGRPARQSGQAGQAGQAGASRGSRGAYQR